MILNISKLNLIGHQMTQQDIQDVLFEICTKNDLKHIVRFLKQQRSVIKCLNHNITKEQSYVNYEAKIVRSKCTISIAIINSNSNTPAVVPGDRVEVLVIIETDLGNFHIKSNNNKYGGCSIKDYNNFIKLVSNTSSSNGDIDW